MNSARWAVKRFEGDFCCSQAVWPSQSERWAGRVFRAAWKLAIIAAIAGAVVWRVRFSPVAAPRLHGPTIQEIHEFVADVTAADLPGNRAVGQRAPVHIQAAGKDPALPADDVPMERRTVADPASAPRWSAAECTVQSSPAPRRAGKSALHWHITVDHFAGEPKYPIGWPRMSLSIKEPAARNWSGWDYLQFSIFTDTTRQALPREPVGLALHAPDKEAAFTRTLSEPAKGQWVRIRIPLAQVPRHDDMRLIQFHISESRYQHGDRLDFYIDEIALVRYARPTLLDFAPESEAVFADARQIPVRFNVTGLRPGESAEVACELRQGGKPVGQTTAKATRGPQRIDLDLSAMKLQPGNYEVVARIAGGAPTAPAPVRLVESPWQSAEQRP